MENSKRVRGEQIRREVMSDAFVDRALANTTDFDKPVQDLIMEVAWGSTWDRDDHLDRKTRSLITIAMLAALRAHEELKGHIRGALRNGASIEEIREVLMHVIPYAGCPAGLSAFKAAKEVLEE